ncbi:MAG: potassium channel protein [Planctomycetaceae bacterium]|nr:potassium channel protein [Planctomycetaceae bacterium]
MSDSLAIENRKAWQVRLDAFLQRMGVELTIGGLIVVSVALTMLELSIEDNFLRNVLSEVNYVITILFAIELALRFAAAPSKRFFLTYALDIVALLPLFRPLRFARMIRLLRLLRLLRLFGIFARHASSFPYIFRRGAIEYVLVSGLILLTVLFSTGAILTFEKDNPEVNSFGKAFSYSIYTLLSGEPIPSPPVTVAGHIVAIAVMFMGMTVFAMFTGTVSAFMTERIRMEGRTVKWEEFKDHTVICGWNRKAEIIVGEYQAASKSGITPIIVIADLDEEPETITDMAAQGVQFLNEDFTRVTALERAGISRAATCIILSDTAHGRSEQDADARTIMAALTAEKLNPNVYTCAEIINGEYGSHLEMGKVNDFVVSGEQSGFLLAQAALNRGLTGIFRELLTHQRGNQFYRIPISPDWIGKTFLDLFLFMKKNHNAILIAVQDTEKNELNINPDDYTFNIIEDVIVISPHPIEL